MKRLTLTLVTMTVAFLGNVAFGQEAAGIPDDVIKELDVLVGTWTVEGKIGDKEQTGGFTCRWMRTDDKKKCCLLGRGTYTTDGKTSLHVSLMGWNAANKCIEDRGFAADGGSGILSWTVTSPGTWRGVLRSVENGKEVTSEGDFIVKGPSEIVMETESETGEVARFVFRKVAEEPKKKDKKKAKEEITKQQFIELGDSLVGQWVMEDRLVTDVDKIGKAGDILTENRTIEWVSNQTALLEKRVYQCNGKVVLEGVAVTAWEGPNKEVTTALFDSLGGTYRFSWSKAGKDWVLRYQGLFGDGRKNSGTSRMTFSADGQTIDCHDTDLVFGDLRLSEKKAAFHRVKK